MPSRRATVIALVVGVLAIVVTVFAIRARIHETASPRNGGPPPGSSRPIVSAPTTPTTSAAIRRIAGATSVAAFGANGAGLTDDTAAFGAAMTAAVASPVRHPKGPSGQPQAV